MSSIFPHEIFDLVLDCLHDDKRALGRIALVAPSWAKTARQHMFRRLEVKNLSEIYDFILKEGRYHLCPIPQVLVMRVSKTDPEPTFSFPLEHFATLLKELPNLHQLDMPSTRLEYGVIEQSHFRQLKSLQISYNWVGNSEIIGEDDEVHSLSRVLSLFSRVESLQLHSRKSLLLQNPPEPPSNNLTPKCSVETLVLDDRVSGSLTKLVISTVDLINVRTLSVVAPVQLSMPPLAQFLQLVPQARDLTIHLPAKGSPDEPEWKLLQLDMTLPFLAAFTLRFAPDGWGAKNRTFIPMDILSTARESSLKHVTIEPVLSQRMFLSKSTSAITDIDWKHAATHLSQFKGLKTITIRVRHRPQMSTYNTQVIKIPPHIKRLVQEGFSTLGSETKLIISDV